ncbi:hypothetical protein JCM1840_005951 [Sporobolomyces johnsonii]
MFTVKAATRVLASSTPSAQVSLPRSALARYLSSDAPAPPAAPQNSHEAQASARPRSLRQVNEEVGSTAQLVALAVKNTLAGKPLPQRPAMSRDQRLEQARRQFARRTPQGEGEGEGQKAEGAPAREGGQLRQPARRDDRRPNRGEGEATGSGLGASLSSRRPERGVDAIALLRGSNARRGPPRSPSSGSPRGDRPSPSGPRPPRRPDFNKRGKRPSAAFQQPSEADMKPLVPPASVVYPSANLAQLLRADLAAKTLQFKAAIGSGVDVNAESQKEREGARKILSGDYSRWIATGKALTGNAGAVEHARRLLAANPSMGLEARETILNKVREALP